MYATDEIKKTPPIMANPNNDYAFLTEYHSFSLSNYGRFPDRRNVRTEDEKKLAKKYYRVKRKYTLPLNEFGDSFLQANEKNKDTISIILTKLQELEKQRAESAGTVSPFELDSEASEDFITLSDIDKFAGRSNYRNFPSTKPNGKKAPDKTEIRLAKAYEKIKRKYYVTYKLENIFTYTLPECSTREVLRLLHRMEASRVSKRPAISSKNGLEGAIRILNARKEICNALPS